MKKAREVTTSKKHLLVGPLCQSHHSKWQMHTPHAPSKNPSQGFSKKSWRVRHHCQDLSTHERYCISPSHHKRLPATISREWGNKDPFGVGLSDLWRSLQPLEFWFCDLIQGHLSILKAQDVGATVLEDSKRTKRPQNNAKNTSQHLIRTSAEFHVQPCSHIPEIKVLEDSVQGFSPQIGTESSYSTRQPHNLKGSRRYPPTVLTGNKEVLQQEKKGFYLSIYLVPCLSASSLWLWKRNQTTYKETVSIL